MNAKIKNYVDVLFQDIASTRKSIELKEEILSNLNEHFEEHIREGKSENQAYTEALADLGDVDELLSTVIPEKEVKVELEKYRKLRARNIAIAVGLYIIGVLCLIGPSGISAVFGFGNEAKLGVIGLIVMLVFCAVATSIIIYTNMSVPQDVEPFLKKQKEEVSFDTSTEKGRFWASFMELYWMIVTIIYLAVSFTIGHWGITWIIWLIAGALKQAICMFAGVDDEK